MTDWSLAEKSVCRTPPFSPQRLSWQSIGLAVTPEDGEALRSTQDVDVIIADFTAAVPILT